jgi:hypothetical protein
LRKIKSLLIILLVATFVATGLNNISVVPNSHSKTITVGTTIAKGESNIGPGAVKSCITPCAIDLVD